MEKKEWVVCINQSGWHWGPNHDDPAPGPKYNDICQIIGRGDANGLPYINLAEWEGMYNPSAFRPIDMNTYF